MSKIGKTIQTRWRRKDVEAEKAAIRAELAGSFGEDKPKERLAHILRRLTELQDNLSTSSQICMFVYVIHALIQHEKRGGLTSAQFNSISSLGFDILRVAGIKHGQSKLADLYGELHVVISQIQRN